MTTGSTFTSAVVDDGEAVAAGHHRTVSTRDNERRLLPRIWDTDWLVLRGMQSSIRETVNRVGKPGLSVLDFGCGDRPYESVFRSAGMSYRGADLGTAAEVVISAGGHVAAPDNCCDVVVSFQVLEHVSDLDTYFSEASRVLRSDGLMILSTHGTWLYHPHPEDHRRWTREGLIGDIERRGFKVQECSAVVGPLAWTTMVRLTCAAVFLRKLPLVGSTLAAAVAVIMNSRAWLEDRMTPTWVTKDNACVYITVSRRSEPV
jgi:SAM-dependent methyltransferase